MKRAFHILRHYRSAWWVWLPLLLITIIPPFTALQMTLVEKSLVDDVILSQRLDLLVPTILFFCLLWLTATAAHIGVGVLMTYFTERVTRRLRQDLLAHCDALSVSFSNREHSGRTMVLFTSDAPMVAGMLGSTVVGAFANVLMLAIGGSTMFGLSWQLGLIVGLIPAMVGGLAWIVTRPLRPASRRVQEKAAELGERIFENLSGLREIVAFGRERSQALAFAGTQQQLMRLRMRLVFMDTGLRTGQTLLSLVLSLALLGYGGYLVITGAISLGTLLAVKALYGYLFSAASSLVGIVSDVQKGMASADRLHAFLDERPTVEERPDAREPRASAGAISFEQVSFSYRADTRVLRDVTFQAWPGEVIALVGPSGAGKSTLASLIARFYDPSEGRVLLDGTDVRDLTLAGLRRQIGMVFQDSFLFATSVRENIAFGREGATEAEVEAAARAANALEFIERLPAGWDTYVGQRGVQLSEGQKQRIAIARALLRDPRILILDEPTSALDARSEHLVQAALDNLMRGRTTFVIAHRLATVKRADRILVIEDGRIVEQGTHESLLRQDGLYRELFDLQFSAGDHADGAPAGAGALNPSCYGVAPVASHI